MAHLTRQGSQYFVRFTNTDRQCKRSLKTTDAVLAEGVLRSVQLTLHRLQTGQLAMPDNVGPGDFIVRSAGGRRHRTRGRSPRRALCLLAG